MILKVLFSMSYLNLKEINIKKTFLGPSKVVCGKEIRGLCVRPYYKHKYGCPNLSIREDCPPRVPFFLDIYKPEVIIAAVIWDFKSYLESMKVRHPDWTDRQLRNPLYWQGYLRSMLKKHVGLLGQSGKAENMEVIFNPEAMGVNVTATCKQVGLNIEWPPRKYMHRVALFAKRK